jgi:predicted phage terminase large subunit-like protein
VPIEDEEQQPNWPEMFDFAACRFWEDEQGPRAYAIERLLKPQAAGDQILREEWFSENTYNRALLSYNKQSQRWEYNGSPLRVYQRVDPAGGKTRDKDDEFALATVGIDPRTETLYLLGLAHVRAPYSRQVELCHSEYDQWRPQRQRIESNACQQWLAQGVLETRTLPVEEYNTTKGKHERIEAWAIPVHNGKVKFDLSQPSQQALVVQALEYPLAAHDDLLDAVSGACEDALELGKGKPGNEPETSGVRRESAGAEGNW